MQAGIVSWAATIGVLIGFGRARGAVLQPLNSIAHPFFGTRAVMMQGFDWIVTPAAIVLHLIVLAIAGVIFALFAARLRGLRLAGAAIAYALLFWLVNRLILPGSHPAGLAGVLSRWELSVFYLVLAASLALGVKLGVGRRGTGEAAVGS